MSDPNPATLIADGLGLPAVEAQPVPEGTRCALYGLPITSGVPVADICLRSHTLVGEFFARTDGWVGVDVARVYRGWSPKRNDAHRSIVALSDGTLWLPRVAETDEHPTWSATIRALGQRLGERAVVIYTPDFRKRIWPYARLTTIGPQTRCVLHDPEEGLAGEARLDWPALVECLDLIEAALAAGLHRRGIGACAVGVGKLPLAETLSWERRLAPWRRRLEFRFALRVARGPAKEAP